MICLQFYHDFLALIKWCDLWLSFWAYTHNTNATGKKSWMLENQSASQTHFFRLQFTTTKTKRKRATQSHTDSVTIKKELQGSVFSCSQYRLWQNVFRLFNNFNVVFDCLPFVQQSNHHADERRKVSISMWLALSRDRRGENTLPLREESLSTSALDGRPVYRATYSCLMCG
jgi:hypothetical protein